MVMRGAFLIGTVITLLIVGLLVMKNVQTETSTDTNKIEKIEHAREAAEQVNKAMQQVQGAVKNSSVETGE